MSAEAGGNGYSSPRYQSFATLLNQLMAARGMNNSQLARAIWGTRKDKRGYDVAQNRDRIGHYRAGFSFPVEANLRKLAAELAHPYEDLAATRPASGRASYTVSTANAVKGMPDDTVTISALLAAILRLKPRMRLEALKILELMRAEDERGSPVNGEARSGEAAK